MAGERSSHRSAHGREVGAQLHLGEMVERASSREQALSELFVVLADGLVADYDVVDLLDQLVAACVGILGLAGAGLLLVDHGSLAVVAASNKDARQLEAFEVKIDDGPCLDSFRTGAAVTSNDLRADRARWPFFAPVALAAGFESVTAVPLRLREETIGSLGMFPRGSDLITAADQRLAQAFADVATIGVLQRRSAEHSAMLTDQLQHAVDSRLVIEQAKGVLAERHTVSLDAAFDALRRYARSHNAKLTHIASAVLGGDLHLGDLTGGGAVS